MPIILYIILILYIFPHNIIFIIIKANYKIIWGRIVYTQSPRHCFRLKLEKIKKNMVENKLVLLQFGNKLQVYRHLLDFASSSSSSRASCDTEEYTKKMNVRKYFVSEKSTPNVRFLRNLNCFEKLILNVFSALLDKKKKKKGRL